MKPLGMMTNSTTVPARINAENTIVAGRWFITHIRLALVPLEQPVVAGLGDLIQRGRASRRARAAAGSGSTASA